MTIFNPTCIDNLTYSDACLPAMGITDQEDADQYFEDFLRWALIYTYGHKDHYSQDETRTMEHAIVRDISMFARRYFDDDELELKMNKLFHLKQQVT